MRKMLAITALTVAGLATVSNAGQVKPVVFANGSAPVTVGLNAQDGQPGSPDLICQG